MRKMRMHLKESVQKKRAEEATEAHETQVYTSADFEEVQRLRCTQTPMGCTRAPNDYRQSVSSDQREDFALKTIEPYAHSKGRKKGREHSGFGRKKARKLARYTGAGYL